MKGTLCISQHGYAEFTVKGVISYLSIKYLKFSIYQRKHNT